MSGRRSATATAIHVRRHCRPSRIRLVVLAVLTLVADWYRHSLRLEYRETTARHREVRQTEPARSNRGLPAAVPRYVRTVLRRCGVVVTGHRPNTLRNATLRPPSRRRT